MLVLTRRVGESFMIGTDVEVKVIKIDGGKLSTGIDAPRDVKVHRLEIYDRIKNGEEQQSKKYTESPKLSITGKQGEY